MEEMPMNIDHKKPENRPLYIFALIAVVVILFLNIFAIPAMQERSVEKTDYSTFLSNVERGNVSKAEVQDDYIYYIVRKNGEDVVCKTVRMDDPDLVSRLYEAGTSMEAVEPQKQSILLSLVIGYVIPIVIFVFLGRWLSKKMMSSMGGGPGGAMSFGKSNAKVYVKSSTGIKFTDVAGEDEAKELLTEIVDYLHNPQKYTEIGASMPTNISTNSEPEMEKNGTSASPATALARRVLPVPGGPTSRAPFGMEAPISLYFAGLWRKSTISVRSSLASSSPATSVNLIPVEDFT